MIQFSFLAKQCNSVFPTLPSFYQYRKKKTTKKNNKKNKKHINKNKRCEFFDSSVSVSGRFFVFLAFVCCKIFVTVVIKVLSLCCVADKWHSVCAEQAIFEDNWINIKESQEIFLMKVQRNI